MKSIRLPEDFFYTTIRLLVRLEEEELNAPTRKLANELQEMVYQKIDAMNRREEYSKMIAERNKCEDKEAEPIA